MRKAQAETMGSAASWEAWWGLSLSRGRRAAAPAPSGATPGARGLERRPHPRGPRAVARPASRPRSAGPATAAPGRPPALFGVIRRVLPTRLRSVCLKERKSTLRRCLLSLMPSWGLSLRSDVLSLSSTPVSSVWFCTEMYLLRNGKDFLRCIYFPH